MSAPSTSGLSVELLLRVIDVKYGCFTLLYFTLPYFTGHFTAKCLAAQYTNEPGVMHLSSLSLTGYRKGAF